MSRFYKGTKIPHNVKDSSIDAIKKFKFREDDILIAAYPRSGTHWLNEITQLIIHGGDPTLLKYRHRRASLEITDVVQPKDVNLVKATVAQVQTDPSRRVLMTNLRPHHFPKQTWSKRIPIIYVIRDPRDVSLSLVEFLCNLRKLTGKPVNEKVRCGIRNLFLNGEECYGSWWDHVIQYEELVKRKENILSLTYEETKADTQTVIKRIAEHIGHDVTDDVVEKVAANSTVETMKDNYGKEMEYRKEMKIAEKAAPLWLFVNKGIAGRWKSECPAEKWKPLQDAFKERVKDTIYAKQYFD